MNALINKLKHVLASFALISLCVAAHPMPAAADLLVNTPGVSCSGKVAQSAVCQEHTTTHNPLTGCADNPKDPTDSSGCGTGILNKITNIIAYLAGAAAIIILIIGAIRFVTSGSDTSVGNRIDDDVLNAKRTITSALIGLAIIVLAKTIINYVITRLG